MSLEDLRMTSSDLLEKNDLDSGGFGKVSLCFHRNHGFVILKKVYTGPSRDEYNKVLLEEGQVMRRLQHCRVVKLLGVIIEDGNYALVMEFMEKGNLMHVLQAETNTTSAPSRPRVGSFLKTGSIADQLEGGNLVNIPLSVKGRIIVETIEGMCYLHGEGVIHKDLKPENILVDNDFHIKIADLGVASFKTWSKLTNEVHNEQRKTNGISKRNGGTLHYMAPEHLSDINAKPTEKSDVYSFGILLWAIFAKKEPYENAICAEQLSLCITLGNRPNMEDIIECCPQEIIHLMEQCWQASPEDRPTFPGIEEKFRPFYVTHLEENIEEDVERLKREYPDQNTVLKRMQSLQPDCVALPPSRSNSEQPGSLHSSQGFLMGPVEESWFSFSPDTPADSDELSVQGKLQEEASYHAFGRFTVKQTKQQPRQNVVCSREEERRRRVSHDPFAQHRPENVQSTVKGLAGPGATGNGNTVPQVTGLTSHTHMSYWNDGLFNSPGFGTSPLDPGAASGGIWCGPNPSHMQSLYKTPVPETNLLGSTPTIPFSSLSPTDAPIAYALYNNTGIQIGSYNYMDVGRMNSQLLGNTCTDVKEEPTSSEHPIFDNSTPLTDKHLNHIRENLGKQWKNCARKLGFSESQIDEIDHDYERDGLKEKVYQMLQKWLMREGSRGSTVGKLAWALHQCHRKDLLSHLKRASQS